MTEPTPEQLYAGSELLVDRDTVTAHVDRWGVAVYAQLEAEALTVIPLLTGGIIPAAWLAERLPVALQLDAMHLTRYRGGTRGGEVRLHAAPHRPVAGRTVLLVDDIFDEGYSLQAAAEWCREHGAVAVYTAVLTRKLHDRGLARDWPDFVALDVPDRYVFGCGMDAFQHWRHLPEIRALDDELAAH